ncbi:MAG: hypothetical protein HYU66_16455, partial [Armatimonadetes bacterium]|nr:hypothetical protein [Armatimonadota bacterium]
ATDPFGLLLVAVLPGSLLAMGVCAVLLGAQGGLVPLLTLALIGDHARRERRQNVYGAIFFWRDMGAASSLLVGQWIRESAGIRSAMFAMAAVSVACAVLSGVLSRRAEEQL